MADLKFNSYKQAPFRNTYITMFRPYLNELKSKPLQDVTRIVLGNSSVDYDSFFGSLIFAFFLTTSTNQFHLPIMDCRREQLKFRFQISEVLSRLKIDQTIFKFQDSLAEVRPDSLYNLYDHNKREGITKVQYIVDHHDYENPIARKYLIAKMGSALTHLYYLINPAKLYSIAEGNLEKQVSEYVKNYERFVENEPFSKQNDLLDQHLELQEIIRYGILLDTFNLDQKQSQRWTIFDKKALEFIQSNNKYEFGYEQLEEIKFDTDKNKKLTLEESLVKDYKLFGYNGLVIEYSIIYLQPKEFYQHYQKALREKFQQKEQTNQIYMLMSIFKGPNKETNRQVAFRVRDNDTNVLKVLEEFLTKLGMKKIDQFQNWHCWKDPKAKISRKIFDKQYRTYYTQLMSKAEL